MPTSTNAGAMSVSLKAISWAVMVEPMLEPKMTPAAWYRSMSPALTKPTTITVVADEDCTSMVKSMPISSPMMRLRVSTSSRWRRLLPAARSSSSPISFMPNRNRPRPPPSRTKSCHVIADSLSFVKPYNQYCVRWPADERPAKPCWRRAS